MDGGTDMDEQQPQGVQKLVNERLSNAKLLNPIFLNRWSPRAFSGEPVSEDELAAVFEAARWAPSCYNMQPWHYIYESDGDSRQAILDTFMDGNRIWAQQAPVVGLVVALVKAKGAGSRDFDVGAATMAMTLQATMLGLYTHMMAGIHVEAAHELIGLKREDGKVICGFVLGRQGDASVLPEFLREREKPNSRQLVSEFVVKGIPERYPTSK